MDGAVGRLPVRGAEGFAIDFAGGRFGNFGAEFDGLGRFDAAQLLFAMLDDLLFGERDAGVEDDQSFNSFSPLFERHADDGAFIDFGERHDTGFDFGTVDVEAAGDDHVFFAVDDIEESVVIAIADIAGVMPAVGANFGGGFGKIVIAGSNKRAARDNFSGLVRREEMAGVVHDGETDGVGGFAATAKALRMLAACGGGDGFLIKEGHEHRSFRLAVGLADAGAEDFDGALNAVWRDGRRGEE